VFLLVTGRTFHRGNGGTRQRDRTCCADVFTSSQVPAVSRQPCSCVRAATGPGFVYVLSACQPSADASRPRPSRCRRATARESQHPPHVRGMLMSLSARQRRCGRRGGRARSLSPTAR
jgi:hypothetical protein